MVYVNLLTCLIGIVLLAGCEMVDLDFDRRMYYQRIPYENVQEIYIFSVNLTRELYNNESITLATILGDNPPFTFNWSNLSVIRSSSLEVQQYKFQIILSVNGNGLNALGVVDVLPPSGAACTYQALGKCSQSCIEDDTFTFGYKCSCFEGYVLQEDNLTCLAIDPHPQLLLSSSSSLDLLDVLKNDTQSVLSEVDAFDYSYDPKVIYYVSVDHSDTISKLSLEPSNSSPESVYTAENLRITDIAKDWIDEEIYYIDSISASINVYNVPSGTSRRIISSLENPRKLLFSFKTRKIFWIAGPSDDSCIMSMATNDSQPPSEFCSIDPVDISSDPASGRILSIASNGSLFSIYSDEIKLVCDIDGENAISLDFFEVFAYVVFTSGSVVRINTMSCSLNDVLPDNDIQDIAVFHPLKKLQFPVTCDPPCLFGGTCSAPNVCDCLETYTGPDCSERECPCLNGGVCVFEDDRVGCRCPSDRTGPQCQFPNIIIIPFPASSDNGMRVGVPVAVILSIIIISVLIVAAIMIFIKYRRRRRKGTKTPPGTQQASQIDLLEN